MYKWNTWWWLKIGMYAHVYMIDTQTLEKDKAHVRITEMLPFEHVCTCMYNVHIVHVGAWIQNKDSLSKIKWDVG